MQCNEKKVAQLWEDMKVLNIEPNIMTYSTSIHGYCMSGEIDLAFSVLEEMESDGRSNQTRSCTIHFWMAVRGSAR